MKSQVFASLARFAKREKKHLPEIVKAEASRTVVEFFSFQHSISRSPAM